MLKGDAHAERKKPATGNLFSLIAAYRISTEFTGRAEVTKKAYRRYLKMIEEEFGTMPLSVVEDRLPERRVRDESTFPPEILLLGAKQSQEVKCFALGHAERSSPHSAISFSDR
jgi:hypothetical protein